jgi:hypothetical protein
MFRYVDKHFVGVVGINSFSTSQVVCSGFLKYLHRW